MSNNWTKSTISNVNLGNGTFCSVIDIQNRQKSRLHYSSHTAVDNLNTVVTCDFPFFYESKLRTFINLCRTKYLIRRTFLANFIVKVYCQYSICVVTCHLGSKLYLHEFNFFIYVLEENYHSINIARGHLKSYTICDIRHKSIILLLTNTRISPEPY